jgi:uncharacterized protein (DUF1330 family)
VATARAVARSRIADARSDRLWHHRHSRAIRREATVAAYLIADVEVTDPAAYEGYKRQVSESIASFGGRYLTRGGNTVVLEGSWSPKRLVIVEFPSMARLKEWYDSPGYAPILALRKRSAISSLVMTDGL